ncbi:MAG: YARHG domain-containing protein [Eggerthellaceae bacterium]|nr:YARHG domain-containing protein [Eggerthellaceae bacterium]
MRCVECGHEIKDGAVFCIRCGAMQTSNKTASNQVGSTPAGVGSAAPRNVKTFEPAPKRGGGGIVVFVIAAIAVLAAIVALAMFALNPNPDPSKGGGTPAGMSISTTSSEASTSSEPTSSSTSSASASTSTTSSSKSASASSASAANAASGSAASAGTTGGTATGATNQNGAALQQQQQQNVTPAPQPAPSTDSSEVIYDSNVREMSKSELQEYSTDTLWLARTEIFARHGRGFRDPYLQNYFNGKSWYVYRYSPDEWDRYHSGDLNSIETRNAATMLEIEKERGSNHI